jgi:DNA excision repair protein ERCC-2
LDLGTDVTIVTQTRDMSLKSREETLMLFKPDQESTHVGLFVMGGIFSESIDLIGDRLSTVMVIGAGLPGLSPYNKILRSHFEAMGEPGFDFAFTYPGLNKVIQAVGRLIRTKDDRGIAVLVDDRFATRKYLRLYPKHWRHLQLVSSDEDLSDVFRSFWDGTDDG